MFIYVYCLAIDARPKWGDGVTGRKCPSLLEDFQTAAASTARKRHQHLPQGVFIVFVLLPDMGSRSSMGSIPFYPSNPC